MARLPPYGGIRPAEEPPILTVTELVSGLRAHLERQYPHVAVEGEVVQFTIHRESKHAYFTLKDDGGELRCVMFRDDVVRGGARRLEIGKRLVAVGALTVFPRSGQLQLRAAQLFARGEGELREAHKRLLEKLRGEGLFESGRKRPIPQFPRVIGVVTSPEGAALRDIVRTIWRRDPRARIILSFAPVQGDGAAERLARALGRLDGSGLADVILLGRGGGSSEDLSAFNQEVLARAIVATQTPVVTGIGHESDRTIADLVADLSVSTPTAAAEHAVPNRLELEERWVRLRARLERALERVLAARRVRFLALERRLIDPRMTLRRQAQLLDELRNRSERSLRRRLGAAGTRLARLAQRLDRADPRARLQNARGKFRMLELRLEKALERRLLRDRARFAAAAGRLEAVSPLKVLGRGFAIVEGERGLVTDAAAVAVGEELSVTLRQGRIQVTVLRVGEPT